MPIFVKRRGLSALKLKSHLIFLFQNCGKKKVHGYLSHNTGHKPVHWETALKFLENETEGFCLAGRVPACRPGGKILLSVDAKALYLFDRETGKTIAN